MSLSSSYVLPTNRIPDLFQKIRDAQAPEQFTQQLLKDWGFTSTNDRAFLPLLKSLGFLSSDGKPTQKYIEYRDHSRSREVLGAALRETYRDLFLIKEQPTAADKNAITGKFKSFHNVSDHVAGLMTKTFYGLLPLADLGAKLQTHTQPPAVENASPPTSNIGAAGNPASSNGPVVHQPGLHYNIQIHLPATKDVEVYNAIFKSLREHLLVG